MQVTWRLIDQFMSLEEFRTYLKGVAGKGGDILTCFDFGSLFDDKYRGGHVCVLDIVSPGQDTVRIIDPGQDEPKWRTIKMEKLYKAMRAHTASNMAGFWEVRVTTR